MVAKQSATQPISTMPIFVENVRKKLETIWSGASEEVLEMVMEKKTVLVVIMMSVTTQDVLSIGGKRARLCL